MTNEELVALIQAGYSGQENLTKPDTQNEQRASLLTLWEQVERFVSMQAGKRARTLDGFGGVTEEDLYQSGFLAMADAVESFDPAAERSFIGWLSLRIRSHFAEAAGYRRRSRDMLDYAGDLDAPISGTDGFTAADTVADPGSAQGYEDAEERVWREQLHAELEKALVGLPAPQGDTLRRRFLQGQTLETVAAANGVSMETIRQRQKKGLRAIKCSPMGRELWEFIEENTPYYLHVGVQRFQNTRTSAVEEIVLKRERLQGA